MLKSKMTKNFLPYSSSSSSSSSNIFFIIYLELKIVIIVTIIDNQAVSQKKTSLNRH